MSSEHGSERSGFPAQKQKWPGTSEEMRPAPDHGEESYRGHGRLQGKVALITGGDSGIGKAVAIAFAREGADVAICYADEEEETDARDTLAWIERADRRGLIVRCDVRDPEACRSLVERTAAELGGLDILVNNAAYQCETERFEELDEQQIRRTFETNLLAPIYLCQAALRHLPEGGVILNTGSVTALEGHESLVDYAATKGGLHTLTKSLAQVVADRRIRVNCVAPGPVWTPLIPATLEEDHVERFGADTAWERAAQPAEIAPSYVFLASSEGAFYTGEILAPSARTTTR